MEEALRRRCCLSRLKLWKLLLTTVLLGSSPVFSQQTEVEITPENANRFLELLERAASGTTFILASDVEVVSTVSVRSPNVTIRGNSRASLSVVRCAEGVDMAFRVSSDRARFANLEIRDCSGTAVSVSSVVHNPNPFLQQDASDPVPLRVEFRNVSFADNGSQERESAGAIFVGRRVTAEINRCVFVNNTALRGGAIHSQGTSLQVNKSVFSNNTAFNSGGAISGGAHPEDLRDQGQQRELSIRSTQFLQNRALQGDQDPRSLTMRSSDAHVEVNQHLKFPRPKSSGGALSLEGFTSVTIKDSDFEDNSAVPAGAAIYLADTGETVIRNCLFRDNFVSPVAEQRYDAQGLQMGGAMFVAFRDGSSRLNISFSSFENNTAVHGGALHVVAPASTRIVLTRNKFTDNRAKFGGGAIIFRNVNLPELSNCDFDGNAAYYGGAILVTNGAGLEMRRGNRQQRQSFRHNTAFDGGAISGIGTGTIRLEHVDLKRNQAYRNGGAVCLVDSKAGAEFILQDTRVLNNTAEIGGALFLENTEHVEVLASSDEDDRNQLRHQKLSDGVNTFSNNAAVAGGAVYYRASNPVRNTVQFTMSRFVNNRVESNLSSIYPAPLDYPGRDEEVSGDFSRRMMRNSLIKNPSNKSLLDPLGEEPCYPGGGGAVCLVLNGLSQQVSVNIALLDSSFETSSASVGGGLFLSSEEGVVWSSDCQGVDESTSAFSANGPCRVLRLRNLTFRESLARFAGGGLFVSNPTHVFYSPAIREHSNVSYLPLAESPYREELAASNTVENGGYGPNIASMAAALQITQPEPDSETGFLISNHSSGKSDPLPNIGIEIMDEMDQLVSAGIADSILRVRATAESNRTRPAIVLGQIDAVAQAGVANFSALAIMAPAGTYELEFEAPRQSIKSVNSSMEIRACVLGEVTEADGFMCELCDVELFSLDPKKKNCDACPGHARCSRGASIVPLPNYWHSSPFSTVILECFNREACNYESRTPKLESQTNISISSFFDRFQNGRDDLVFTNEEYTQCEKSYEGPLCGSCADGYGRTNSKTCRKCESKGVTSAVVLGIMLWQLVFVCITLRNALVSIKDMNQMMQLVGNCSTVFAAPVVAIPNARPTKAPGLEYLRDILNDPQNAGMTPEQYHEIYEEFHEQLLFAQVDSVPNLVTTAREQNAVDSIVAIQHASETIKIFVNFLQMTSVAINVNVEWTQTVRQMLETMKPIGGISSEAAFAPLTCLLDRDVNYRSIYGEILRVSIPLGIIMVLLVYYSIRWLIMARRPNSTRYECRNFLKSRVIISFLVVMFFSYQSLSEEFMGMVSCVKLDSNEINSKTLYPKYSIAKDRYWSVDTSIKCFERKHALLAVCLGIPGIIFFLFAVPVCLLFFLLHRRAKGKLLDVDMVNTYGFIYQNYRKRFVFWEVCILARKALIGVVVVFAYPLGSNLQGIMALGVLILALWMHLTAIPFKYTILNAFEGCSLLVSIFTFYAGLVFNDENTTHTGDDFLSVALVLINVVLALTLLVSVVHYLDKYAVAKLKVLGVQDIPRNFILRSWKLVNVVSGQALTTLRDTIRNRFSGSQEEGTSNQTPTPARASSAYQPLTPRAPAQYSDVIRDENVQNEITVELPQDSSNE